MTATAAPTHQTEEHKLIMYAEHAADHLDDLLRRAEQHVNALKAALVEAGEDPGGAQNRLDGLVYLVSRTVEIFEDDCDRIGQEAIDHHIIDTDGNRLGLPVQIEVAP